MDLSRMPAGITIPTRKCPHLGLYHDLTTWSATDQVPNYCHYQRKPSEVDWSHQCKFCFDDAYSTCPFLKTPPTLTRMDRVQDWVMANRLATIAMAAVILVIAGLLIWNAGFPPLFKQALASPEENQPAMVAGTQSMVVAQPAEPQATATPESTYTAQPSPTVVKTRTPMPSPTITPTIYQSPTPGPGLMTPFGAQQLFVVHTILPGESLELLSVVYSTNDAVLRVINGLKPGEVLWADRTIAVLPGVKDPNNVQPRKPLYLETDTTVESLVAEYGGTAEQLRLENGLGNDSMIRGERWLVVP